MEKDNKVISLHKLCEVAGVGYVNIHNQLKRKIEERTIKPEYIERLNAVLDDEVEKFKQKYYE